MAAMTEAEVRTALNLRKPGEYRIEAMWRAVDAMADGTLPRTVDPLMFIQRRTGRTTRLVVKALSIMSRGTTVGIAARDRHMRDHALREVKAAANRLGIDARLVRSHDDKAAAGQSGPVLYDGSGDELAEG